MDFGFYLHEQGVVSSDDLVAALMMQNTTKVPIGALAMETGKLAVRNVLTILRVQSDLPNDRFGDIAVELGLMTKRDLAELLMEQSDRRPRVEQCLVELGALSQQQMEEELATYRRERERGGAGRVHRVTATQSTLPQAAMV